MIQIDLSLFGGRGGKGGGGGGTGAGHNTGSGKAKSSEGSPSHRGSAGGRLMDNNGPARQSGVSSGSRSTDRSASRFGSKVTAINPKETYVVLTYDKHKEGNPKKASGEKLYDMIKKEELVYNKTLEIWKHKNGQKFIIRKR